MLRRLSASLLLATLLTQAGVALAACHRSGGEARHARVPAAAAALAHEHDAHGAAAAVGHRAGLPSRGADAPLGHVCNWHHPGPCPHQGRTAFAACGSDPVAGLQVAAEAGLPRAAADLRVAASPTLLPILAPSLPAGAGAPLPELPPPRV